MNWFFLTLGYSGLSPKAPGTVGSFVALLIGIPLLAYLGAQTLFFITLVISILAIKAIDIYEQKSKSHDDKRIVIDELAGMWIALSIAPGTASVAWNHIFEIHNGYLLQSIIAFVLFRYFDITKPSIIGRIDQKVHGGLGVMGDDIIAGFVAGILTALIWQYLFLKLIFPLLS
jgi:phosphatidylglycerophosphatase A